MQSPSSEDNASGDPPSEEEPQTWRHRLRQGIELLASDRLDAAERLVLEADRLAPGQPLVWVELGRIRMRQGRHAEAEALLRQALGGKPDLMPALVSLARLLGLHQSRIPEAMALVDEALRRHPGDGPLLVVRGELSLDLGDIEAACRDFEAVNPEGPAGERARKGLARCENARGIGLSEAGQIEQALFYFKRAADLDPGWSGPCANQAVALGRLGRPERAIDACDMGLLREPHNPLIYFNKGSLLLHLGRLDEAVQAFEELLVLDPHYKGARMLLGNLLGRLGRLDESIACLLEALEHDESDPGCWSSLGLCYVCTGNVERGEACLRRALELDAGYLNAVQNLLNLLVAQQRLDEARQILERARGLDPGRTSQMLASTPHLQILQSLDIDEIRSKGPEAT